MSENVPNTPVPPTPGEAAKVQPKKETVRIALPPKPTAAPTVRLPAPAPSAVAAAGGGAAPAALSAPRPPAAPTSVGGPPKAGPAPSAAPSAPAAPALSRPMASAPSGAGVSGLDRGLAVAVTVLSLASLVHVAIIAFGIQVE